MDDLIISLIVFQSVFTWIGYFGLARQIKSERKRLEAFGSLIAFMPALTYALPLCINWMNIAPEQFIGFFEFYFYGLLANIPNGIIIKIVEKIFLTKKRW